MIGYILLLIAIGLYFFKHYRYISLFLYVSFMMGSYGGFNLWTDQVLGVKNMDLAFVYTFAINGYLLLDEHNIFRPFRNFHYAWTTWYKILLFFLLCSVVFSFVHYYFSLYQIIQGGRSFFLLLSLPILIRVKPVELQRILEICLWITVVTSVLYILQVVVGHPLMPYRLGYKLDPSTGLVRLYNIPVMLSFFFVASFVCPRFFLGNVNVYRAIFFTTLVCTLGRTYILSTLLAIVLANVMIGKASYMMKTIAVIGILFLPFMGIITQRFEGSNTTADFENIMSGNYEEVSSGDATMTYRIAWIYERYDYLKDRPLGEQIFGLGLISESQDVVRKMYRFSIGIYDEVGNVSQLATPDTSYGNLLTKMGFVGMFIYLVFCITLAVCLFQNRMKFPLMVVCAANCAVMFISSMSGSTLSEPRNFTFYFLAIGILYNGGMNKRILNRKSKWLLLNK